MGVIGLSLRRLSGELFEKGNKKLARIRQVIIFKFIFLKIYLVQ